MSEVDLELTGRAVEIALAAGAGDAEAYAERSSGTEVRVHGGEIESLTATAQRGVGVRAWIEGRAGYAYGTDLTDDGLREIGSAAAAAAKISDRDEHAAPPVPAGEPEPLDGLRDEGLEAWDGERKAALTLAVEAAAKAADPRVRGVEQAVYADSQELVAVSSSAGIAASYEATSCFSYAYALASDSEGTRTGLGFGLGRGPDELDPEAIGAEAAERSTSLLGASKPPSCACPVVFDQAVAASFAGTIASMLGADAAQRGRSPFADRLGEEIASPALQLRDDGRDPAGLRSAPVDGEGLPHRVTDLIAGGRLKTYLHDSYTARRAGTESTGSAGRGSYRAPPSVSASNLVVEDGEDDREALLAAAGEGILVQEVVGLHSGVNPVSGTFSVGASGHRISDGSVAEPLAEFTIAGELVSMLTAVQRVGRESRWVPFGGSVRTPLLLLAELTVSGA